MCKKCGKAFSDERRQAFVGGCRTGLCRKCLLAWNQFLKRWRRSDESENNAYAVWLNLRAKQNQA